ncbi:dihydroxyacetone kinase [Mycoplasmopsis bovirhinis]|uniref:PTS-dependent dihydroxyacetone kinase phosphotransferase subunit DhaM n=1 Tax=Mycoplasmopsis bovirhinis TaxID=29553 RepID=UPI000C05CC38|nr:dihydroxyacetone kinase [Mycoplasmopsis bovirhinis]ATO30947.1 dihydroxyacetone kinase [Mycoplasmopsis bovirhinis]
MTKKLFILISHYYNLANTLKEYLTKMLPINNDNIKIIALGGVNQRTELGTEPMQILEAIEANSEINEIFIYSDLGSATLGAQAITNLVSNKEIYVAKGAFVENTFAAYVLANAGASFNEVKQASEEKIAK